MSWLLTGYSVTYSNEHFKCPPPLSWDSKDLSMVQQLKGWCLAYQILAKKSTDILIAVIIKQFKYHLKIR